jgi:hypothetical protein
MDELYYDFYGTINRWDRYLDGRILNKKQKMVVNTKKGLITAFECCRNSPAWSRIILIRKSGKPIEWLIKPFPENKSINSAKAAIRKIKAAELLG